MKREMQLLVGIWVLAAVGLGACQLPFAISGNDASLVATQSAKLIEEGRLTQTANARPTSGQKPEVTSTPQATELSEYTQTPTSIGAALVTSSAPGVTPTPYRVISLTPRPSITLPPPVPTATSTQLPCDIATFVKDLTVPDGSIFSPGATFTKSWRLLNAGKCTWTTDYAVVFDSGTQMGGKSPQILSVTTATNEYLDISVTMTAPSVEGHYRGLWKLRNTNGTIFGTGLSKGGSGFYVDIVVKKTATNYAYDFVDVFCGASWTSAGGTLACPSATGSGLGYVQRIDAPVLENSATDNEPALLMVPQAQTDGYISGKYGFYTVQSGDTFRTVLSCAQDAPKCSVKYQLDYIVDGETIIQTAGNWTKSWDGKLNFVVLDLSPLAGKNVRFILTVFANGEMNDDRAMWLAPRILHK